MHEGEVGLRIGDDERAAVDARLQQAVGRGQITLAEYEERSSEVWRARTRGELETLTRDLPVAPVPAVPPAPPPAAAWRPRRVVAVMSGDVLSGPVQPGQDVQAYALMGGATVDLRRDDLPAHVRVRAVAVMGGVEVLVPRGVTVHLSGASLMGGRQVSVDPPRAGAPVVEVAGYALMGGVEVKHAAPPSHADGPEPVRLTKQPAAVPPPKPTRVPDGSVRVRRPLRHRRRAVVLWAVALVAVGVGVPAVASADDSAVFGSRVVHVKAGETRHVGVLFGSVKVVVDGGARVELGGGTVFGSSQCRACDDASASGSVAHVTGRGAFGSIEVVRPGDSSDPGDG